MMGNSSDRWIVRKQITQPSRVRIAAGLAVWADSEISLHIQGLRRATSNRLFGACITTRLSLCRRSAASCCLRWNGRRGAFQLSFQRDGRRRRNVYVAEASAIRKVTGVGVVTTLAGTAGATGNGCGDRRCDRGPPRCNTSIRVSARPGDRR
jgi:hypothetical protein